MRSLLFSRSPPTFEKKNKKPDQKQRVRRRKESGEDTTPGARSNQESRVCDYHRNPKPQACRESSSMCYRAAAPADFQREEEKLRERNCVCVCVCPGVDSPGLEMIGGPAGRSLGGGSGGGVGWACGPVSRSGLRV